METIIVALVLISSEVVCGVGYYSNIRPDYIGDYYDQDYGIADTIRPNIYTKQNALFDYDIYSDSDADDSSSDRRNAVTDIQNVKNERAPDKACAVALPPFRSGFKGRIFGHQRSWSNGESCITYGVINEIYQKVRESFPPNLPKQNEEWDKNKIGSTGVISLEVSKHLAERYKLNAHEINTILPQIPTEFTMLADICPDYMNSIKCIPGRYRRFDGLCNNENNPSWGATRSAMNRIKFPAFSDGFREFRRSLYNEALPNVRRISTGIHQRGDVPDLRLSLLFVHFGQFMDHDMTLQNNRDDTSDCCNRPADQMGPYCEPIRISSHDFFYSQFNRTCMSFIRHFPGHNQNCRLGPSRPFNSLTSVIDANTIYGGNDADSKMLRSFVGGQLRTTPFSDELKLKPLLPPNPLPCDRTSQQLCFIAGEARANEVITLTVLHTFMTRHHNNIASALHTVNPHWTDEKLFNEARHIVAAHVQRIAFNEFLPLLIGDQLMKKYNLYLTEKGHWPGYNRNQDPGAITEFSAAAYRLGHTLLPTFIERWSEEHMIERIPISNLILRPFDLYTPGKLDTFARGMLKQTALAFDASVTSEVTNHLFRRPNQAFGADLISLNLQRGRDFGLNPYMAYRKHFGLPTCDSWSKCRKACLFDNQTLASFERLYRTPLDIDLFTGGVSEEPIHNAVVGPTFGHMIATQFSNIRSGDSYWHELPDRLSSFTVDQLEEIRNVRLAKIICENSDSIEKVQMWPFLLHHKKGNPYIKCNTNVLPKFNPLPWKE